MEKIDKYDKIGEIKFPSPTDIDLNSLLKWFTEMQSAGANQVDAHHDGGDYGSGEQEFTAFRKRLESDEEFTERMSTQKAKEEKEREELKERNTKREKEEYEKYLALKEKYEK